MIDWLSSMSQTYEYFEVDPNTWADKKRISSMLSSSVKRDLSTETLESASFSTTDKFNECYIRIYLVATQDGVSYRECLGTFLVQTPSYSFDGKNKNIKLDAYSPLLELKDISPEIGYTLLSGINILDSAYTQTKNHLRAPVVKPSANILLSSNFTAESDETWLSYLTSLISSAGYYYLLDDMSRVLFCPDQDINATKSVWIYDDGNSSILYPSIDDEYDLYGIPNVVEVVYSQDSGVPMIARVENNSSSSPTSIKSRGREVLYRETNPSITGTVTDTYLKVYAEKLLINFNLIQHTLTYTHGYCGTRIGDCVTLNYSRAGIANVKARITSQSIECGDGCPVTETAVYTTDLWKE